MEQVEGGDLVVTRGDEPRAKDGGDNKRDMNAAEGYETALKLAQVTFFARPFYPAADPRNRLTSKSL